MMGIQGPTELRFTIESDFDDDVIGHFIIHRTSNQQHIDVPLYLGAPVQPRSRQLVRDWKVGGATLQPRCC